MTLLSTYTYAVHWCQWLAHCESDCVFVLAPHIQGRQWGVVVLPKLPVQMFTALHNNAYYLEASHITTQC